MGNCGRVRRGQWRRGCDCSATATRAWLFFMQRGPTHAGGDGRLVKFALDHVLGAAVIEAEDLIIDVKSIHDKGQAVPHSHATLGIELEVCVKVVVAQRAGYAAISAVGEPVTSDIRSV